MVSEGGSVNYWPKYGLTIHIGLSELVLYALPTKDSDAVGGL